MAVQRVIVTCDETDWVEGAPGITSATFSLENQGSSVIKWVVAPTKPDQASEVGFNIPPGHGFFKQALEDATHEAGALKIWLRGARAALVPVLVEYVD